MHLLIYVLLIAGSALAHYRVYDTRNLIERDEPENEVDRLEEVECPVCENASSWQVNNEECPIVRAGKTYKVCKYGVYMNAKCGNRPDCFRGPNEQCTEKRTVDYFGQRCAHGYFCHPILGKCTGIASPVNSKLQWYINPNERPNDHAAFSPNYPIRARRQI